MSAAIQAGPRVWVSGVIGDTKKHRTDVTAQTRDIFARMQPTLAAAGIGFGDVIDTTVYLRDTADWPKVDAVTRDVFAKNPPARTATGARGRCSLTSGTSSTSSPDRSRGGRSGTGEAVAGAASAAIGAKTAGASIRPSRSNGGRGTIPTSSRGGRCSRR